MEKHKLKAFVSWSGGKDAALSCHRAMKDYEVTCLLNMVSEDGATSRAHGVRTDVLRMQAEAMELPIVQRRTSWETYEREFKAAVSLLKEGGIEAGIFGDIDLAEHRAWVERVCREAGVSAVLPIWEEKRDALLEEFIDGGFEALVISVRNDMLGPEWLGRVIDGRFVAELSKRNDVDLSGENGEYHTLVVSGPIFKKKVRVVQSKTVVQDERSILDVTACEVVERHV
jgi:diphthine-ammonia ligase